MAGIETTRVRVTAPDGRYIPGYGSRARGETFDLPAEIAATYLTEYPDDYALADPDVATEEA